MTPEPNLPGEFGDSAPASAIDLRKPGDLNLVYRSVLNGWAVPQRTRDHVSDQVIPAMNYYLSKINSDARSGQRLITLCRLLLLMDCRNRIDDGEPKGQFPCIRKRRPDRRTPRHLRPSSDHVHMMLETAVSVAASNPDLAKQITDLLPPAEPAESPDESH